MSAKDRGGREGEKLHFGRDSIIVGLTTTILIPIVNTKPHRAQIVRTPTEAAWVSIQYVLCL